MRTKEDARALIDAVKKVPLGFYPTPFHKLERMSELSGVNLWVKREDFSGVSLFGGNKVRKLEFLLADAVRKGCAPFLPMARQNPITRCRPRPPRENSD